MIYLDSNATTQPDQAVVEAMTDCLAHHWHNPSSVHRAGQEARRLVELARKDVAALLGVRPREVTFTSGGTESLISAIRGTLAAYPTDEPATIVTTAIEHSAVRDLLPDLLRERPHLKIEYLPLTNDGLMRTDSIDAITPTTSLVCLHWANNETGAIQPVEHFGKRCRELGVPFLVDGTQYVGKYKTDLSNLPIDMLACSAHKLHGPKGTGALVLRQGTRIKPMLVGSQELGKRGGTENAPGIVGFGAAAKLAQQWLDNPERCAQQQTLRDRLEQGLLRSIHDAVVNSPQDNTHRLWNTLNIGFPGLEAEALLMLLSEQGLCASAGAACSSGSLDPSPILLAIGVPESIAHGSIRLSLSRNTTQDEIDSALQIIPACVHKLRESSRSVIP